MKLDEQDYWRDQLTKHKGDGMKTRQVIGVVGYGYVGEAVAKGFAPTCDVIVYDNKKGWFGWQDGLEVVPVESELQKKFPLDVLVKKCSVVFICVPTPMQNTGALDSSIVEGVVDKLEQSVYRTNVLSPIVVIKSTVLPGTTDRLQEEYDCLKLMFNPEFLREATYLEDFRTQKHVILGTTCVSKVDVDATKLGMLYATAFPDATVHHVFAVEAEMVKYVVNCFLATKLSFANEVKLVCDAESLNYDFIIKLAQLDPRLGTSHWQVPGHDSRVGFGGACLVKDLNAFMHHSVSVGVWPNTLLGAWTTNLQVRPEQDWLELKGRAVRDAG